MRLGAPPGTELSALGHDGRLMPPVYVKAYVKHGKANAADAEAISEAVTRPTMRLVAIKTREQQAAMIFHKSRDLLIRQRTMLINALRGHLGEYSLAAPQGAIGARAVLNTIELGQAELLDPAHLAFHSLEAVRALAERALDRASRAG